MRTMSSRFKQIVLCPLLPKILMKSDLLLERLTLLVLKVIYFLLPCGQVVNLVRASLADASALSSSLTREMTRRQNRVNKGSFWGCQQWPEVQRNSSSLGKGAKTKSLQHDKCALAGPCRSSAFGFLPIEPFASEDLIFWTCVRTATRHWWRPRRGRERLHLFCSAKRLHTRLVLFTLSSLGSIITTGVSYSGWNRSRGSESASTWLSRSFCTTTECIQLETECVAEYVREDDEGSRQLLCLVFARLTRRSIEPILASLDHVFRRSTSVESSNL